MHPFSNRREPKPDFGFKEHSTILYERFRSVRLKIKVPPRVFKDEELRQLDMPAPVLIGEQEFMHNATAGIERAKRILPEGDAQLLSDCNHAIVSDQPERISRRLQEFFGK